MESFVWFWFFYYSFCFHSSAAPQEFLFIYLFIFILGWGKEEREREVGRLCNVGVVNRKTDNTRLTILPKTKNKSRILGQIDRKPLIEYFLEKIDE
jgi:hypothetical protein